MSATYLGYRCSLVGLTLLALIGCEEKDNATLDATDLAFAGPADPNGFQAPPTITIDSQSGLPAPTLGYNGIVRCSAAVTVLRQQLRKAGQLGPREQDAVSQAATIISRRLQMSATAAKKAPSDVAAEIAVAVSNAEGRPHESVREALECMQRMAT